MLADRQTDTQTWSSQYSAPLSRMCICPPYGVLFYRATLRYAIVVYVVVLCPFVCPSVTTQSSVKTVERIKLACACELFLSYLCYTEILVPPKITVLTLELRDKLWTWKTSPEQVNKTVVKKTRRRSILWIIPTTAECVVAGCEQFVNVNVNDNQTFLTLLE